MSKRIDDRPALVDRAQDLRHGGENAEAIVLFNELLREHPTPDLYNERGLAHSALGDREAAIADFTKGIDLDPNDPELLTNRGNEYLWSGDYVSAIHDYNAVVSATCEPLVTAHAYNGRGWAKWQLGQADAAICDFVAAIRVDDAYASPLHNLALVLIELDRRVEAAACLDRALQILPEDVSTLCLRSDVHRWLNHFSEALDDCTRAHLADSSDPEPRWRIAWLRSTSADPAIRDGKDALAHALAACEATDFENVSCLTSLAAAYGECGQFQEAVRWQEKAVALASGAEQQWPSDCLGVLKSGRPLRYGQTEQDVEELFTSLDDLLEVLPAIFRKRTN